MSENLIILVLLVLLILISGFAVWKNLYPFRNPRFSNPTLKFLFPSLEEINKNPNLKLLRRITLVWFFILLLLLAVIIFRRILA